MEDFNLYWEDVDERLIYAEFDDLSWQLAEELFGYKKTNSLYIYHDGRLAAFYSSKDTTEEARVGYNFYSNPNNVLRVIKIKVDAKKDIDDFLFSQKDLKLSVLSNKDLHKLIIKSIGYQFKGLKTHFLTQANFFEQFESEGDLKHLKTFEELSKARFEYSRKGWSAMLGFNHQLFSEYGKRHSLTLPEAESMIQSELISEKFNKDVLKLRANKYVFTSDFHKHKIYIESDADEFIKKYEKYENTDFVKGVIGNRGIVKAPAFVLKNEFLNLKNLPKSMEKGMVLIVQNSWPELSEYYKFASAIVTNEGGITSHGVVVAREFGIPCIVATKIATKIFKTGDLVEVDADHGIVRIVK